MPLITSEQKELETDWYDHLKPGDYFHTGNPVTCGICGCQSDYLELVRWMVATKLHLICPGHKIDRELHMKIDRKKDLLYEDALPDSALEEVAIEIIRMRAQIREKALDRKYNNSQLLKDWE